MSNTDSQEIQIIEQAALIRKLDAEIERLQHTVNVQDARIEKLDRRVLEYINRVAKLELENQALREAFKRLGANWDG